MKRKLSLSDTEDENDNEIPNLGNTTQMKSLIDSVLSNAPTIENSHSTNVQSALQTSSSHSSRSSFNSFDDTIRSYIESSVLFTRGKDRSKYYLSIEQTLKSSGSNPLASNKVFIANINFAVTDDQLKTFFATLGFTIVDIYFPKKTSTYNNGGIAFVRFDSSELAEVVLDNFERNPKRFRFQNRDMKISRPRLSQRPINTNIFNQFTSDTFDFDISYVLYGTLINSNTIAGGYFADELRFIAHRLVENENQIRTLLRINVSEKKIAIIIKHSNVMYNTSTEILFEWSFENLRAEKISPIRISRRCFSLLIQIKQPPVILQKVSEQSANSGHEKRLPGTPLIGHANAWLVYLSGQNVNKDYIRLFQILNYYNLTPKRFFRQNILKLMNDSMKQDNYTYFRHVDFLSNDQWMKENRQLVDHFLNNRWPRYPFEIKFEIMKLLSKHILTIHNLIIDDQFDLILAKCSLNIVINCAEKIVTYASYWFHEICGEENENDTTTTTTEESPMNMENDDDDDNPSMTVLSAMGTLINVKDTDFVLPTDNIDRLNIQGRKKFPGHLSWLLMRALKELQAHHELRRTKTDGIFVSKHELHSDSSSSNIMSIRKIYITPSTILYEGPYNEEKCLVTRQFSQVNDGFLRVCFRDENYKKLQSISVDMSKLYERIKSILADGIEICDRYYDFLAFSNSQIREHCCWMFSPMKTISAESIRRSMGTFTNIHPVAKMAARLGQSFSTTKKGTILEKHQHKQIPDEKSNELCLTDGIGIISPWLAKKLSGDDDEYPCAFQIRFGGYKGMLCLDVAKRITEPNVGLYLRPSMNKFTSENLAIDVVRSSDVSTIGFLNRQIVLLLSTLGIDDEVFLSMQDQMLEHLKTLPTNPEKAREFLRKLGVNAGNGYHAFLIEYLKRFRHQIDPFVRKLLIAFQGFLLKEIRVRARVFVPNTWNILGVIDETKTLKYGQVFVQIEERNELGSINTKIITGPVIVTRTPCFHPGDIRRLEAVDIPALHQLKNVIVFPLDPTGSHPTEMSGGDLDGDLFWISSEEKLLFKENEQPFDYHDQANENAKQNQKNVKTEYTINDVTTFFVEYIESDNLGMIADSHLAFADQISFGARGAQCLKLARMHSTAVDFAKTGVRAERITGDLRLTKLPHFMENTWKPNYHSQTILGKLYDSVVEFERNLNQQEQFNSTNEIDLIPYEKLMINGSQDYLASVQSTKFEYDLEFRRIMRQYGIRNEAELVSGYILQFTSKQYVKQRKLYDLKNEISHSVKILQNKYLHIFYKDIYEDLAKKNEEIRSWSETSKDLSWKKQLNWFEFHTKTDFSIDNELAKKASAWFTVTYNPEQKKHSVETQPLFSFAWIVYPILMKIFDETQL